MFRKIRIAAAAITIASLTLLFLDYTGTLRPYLGWSARIQIVPAFLARDMEILLIVIAATLLLGRVYCSAICPLGIFQDVVSRLAGIGKKDRFSYRPPKKSLIILRYGLFAAFIISIIIGTGAVIDPYGLYGRMGTQILGPLYKMGNNVLAGFAERSGSFAFYRVDIWLKSAGALVIAALTFVVVGAFAFKSGRGYCNTLCPVGAFLSIIAAKSPPPYAQAINKEKCGSCGLCAKNCKAGCIDPVNKEVDYFRCVSCYNCLERCPSGALTFSKPKTGIR